MGIKLMGKWWNDKNLEIYNIEGENYVLNGWNGESYLECFKVAENLIDVLEGGREYTVVPKYEEIGEDNFQIVGYSII